MNISKPTNRIRQAIYITGDDRITSDVMSKNEFAKVCMTRAAQIQAVNMANCEMKETIEETVLTEIDNKTCPLTIKRELNRTDDTITYEIWHVSELALPVD